MRPCAPLALIAAAVVAISGCSRSSGPARSTVPADYLQQISTELDGARSAGATSQQLDVLQRAVSTKSGIAFADYDAAVRRSLACMSAAGIDVQGPTLVKEQGIEVLNYLYRAKPGDAEDEMLARADQCMIKHSIAVEGVWRAQPAAVEYAARVFEVHRPALLSCLAGHGVQIDADASKERILTAVAQLSGRDRDPSDEVDEGPDCLSEAGST